MAARLEPGESRSGPAGAASRPDSPGPRCLTEEPGEAILALDREGRIVFANRRFHEILGRDAAAHDDLRFPDLMAPRWREAALAAREAAARGTVVQGFAAALRGRDGSAVPVSGRVVPLGETGGAVAFLLRGGPSGGDLEAGVSDRCRRGEAHLLEEVVGRLQEFLAQARHSGDFNVAFANPDLERCWAVKDCSLACCPCFGRPPMRCWQIAGTHCGGQVQGAFAQKLPLCEACEVYQRATASPLANVIETFNNVLHLVQVKQVELVQARLAAEEANRAQSLFLQNLSHEFRTPLHAVLGLADVLLESDLDPEQRENVLLLRKSGHDLLALLDDVLDFSVVDARRVELAREDFEVAAVVELVAGLHALLAREKGIGLTCHVRPDVPRWLRGDAARLRKLLASLVDNAVKFTDRGEVSIEVGVEEASRDGVVMWGTVSDTGIGIPRENLERIFTPFVQVDPSISRRHGGVGLGLSLARKLARLMGGNITAESRPGRGSVFRFTARFAPSPRPESRSAGGGERAVLEESL